jgi:hypothetical protein
MLSSFGAKPSTSSAAVTLAAPLPEEPDYVGGLRALGSYGAAPDVRRYTMAAAI